MLCLSVPVVNLHFEWLLYMVEYMRIYVNERMQI